MKALTLAVAVAVVVAIIGVQQSSADLVIEGPELMDGLTNGSPAAAGQDNPEDSWKMPYTSFQRRARGCRFCCGCCPNMRGCGICCRF
ncbi:hepcidin-like [Xiphophorus maculatus]|uniref:Hepcidin-like n=1 Tax=Xiphophorus maculatus TaxID=8083 RepID=M4A3Z5_XIPMA|nr:hepcidin-like [Xiphophorus maculatus]XP_027872158.1 hepcidin-like [Xiphophorus couchianus]